MIGQNSTVRRKSNFTLAFRCDTPRAFLPLYLYCGPRYSLAGVVEQVGLSSSALRHQHFAWAPQPRRFKNHPRRSLALGPHVRMYVRRYLYQFA